MKRIIALLKNIVVRSCGRCRGMLLCWRDRPQDFCSGCRMEMKALAEMGLSVKIFF